MPASKKQAQAEAEQVRNEEFRRGTHGPAGPWLYPRRTAQIAEICRLLIEMEVPDPNGRESTFYATGTITLWDSEDPITAGDPICPIGWITQLDEAAWVFVPYVPEVEEDDGAADRHRQVGRRHQYNLDRTAVDAGEPLTHPDDVPAVEGSGQTEAVRIEVNEALLDRAD